MGMGFLFWACACFGIGVFMALFSLGLGNVMPIGVVFGVVSTVVDMVFSASLAVILYALAEAARARRWAEVMTAVLVISLGFLAFRHATYCDGENEMWFPARIMHDMENAEDGLMGYRADTGEYPESLRPLWDRHSVPPRLAGLWKGLYMNRPDRLVPKSLGRAVTVKLGGVTAGMTYDPKFVAGGGTRCVEPGRGRVVPAGAHVAVLADGVPAKTADALMSMGDRSSSLYTGTLCVSEPVDGLSRVWHVPGGVFDEPRPKGADLRAEWRLQQCAGFRAKDAVQAKPEAEPGRLAGN